MIEEWLKKNYPNFNIKVDKKIPYKGGIAYILTSDELQDDLPILYVHQAKLDVIDLPSEIGFDILKHYDTTK